ncbi:MAG: outer membrane protein assembly factor BamA [SAR324 cluster bacterium]|uniref:Outer membrane protein assembly factor BamA n=1 Tax=SAR324 cluster bacterium TaxID=2024889 RepID=A0A7X9FT47_9DELT|nr:outer membrane protein assembly factor BamA [SAR324 cluster bacterium]
MPIFSTGVVASSYLLEEVREKLVNVLRKEGFIAARIDVHYENELSIDKVKLVVRSVVGKPVTFKFQGNKAFKVNEFLDTINIFSRRIPFGSNTVNLLIENMGLLYRRSGYLYASISKQQSLSDDGSRLIFTITIDEGKKVHVSEVSVKGNSEISLEQIETAFLNAGEVYYRDMFHPDFAVSENIREHADFLSNYYIHEGYPDVRVESRIESTEDEDKVRIIYTIEEGRSNRGDWVIVEGIPDEVEEPEIPKTPYSLTKANDYIREVLNALRRAAYFNPIINSSLISDGTQLKFLVFPGEKSTVDKIIFEGNVVVSEETLRKNLSLKEGSPWEAKNIQESRLKLLKTGLFSNVDIHEEKNGSDTKRTLRIVVKEKPLQTLQLGGGLNSEYGLHIFGEGSDMGLFKDGRSLSLRLDAYYDSVNTDVGRSAVNLRYLDPTFGGSNVSFTEDLRYVKQSLANQEFDLDRVSLTTAFYDTMRSGLTLSAGHTIFEERLNDVSPDAILSPLDYGVLNISSLAATLRYDKRDSALIPTRGFFASLDAGLASEMIASDANYYSLNGKFSYLIPLHLFDRRFVISLASRLASAWTFDGTPEIPISQRFYAGGRTSVRGFSENSLGPRGLNGSVIGGDVLAVNNIQFNYLMNDSFAWHSFFDFGNIYLREREIDMTDLRKGTGLGMEYLSPVGPIGIDIGFPLQRRAGESSYRIYFTVGTLF